MTQTLEETVTPASCEVFMKTFAAELAIEMSFLCDEDGRATGILGVTRDITERRRKGIWSGYQPG